VLKPKLTSGLRDTREFSRRCRGLSKRGEILLVDGRWTFAWYRLRNCASAQQVGSRKFKGTASCFRSLSKTREFASANSLSSPPPLPNNFSPECESQVAVVYIVQKERARERERGGGKSRKHSSSWDSLSRTRGCMRDHSTPRIFGLSTHCSISPLSEKSAMMIIAIMMMMRVRTICAIYDR